MSWYAIDAVDRAFSRTRKALFEPFDFWKWVKLAIIIFFVGSGSNYGGTGANYQTGFEDFVNNYENLEHGEIPGFLSGISWPGLSDIESISTLSNIVAIVIFFILFILVFSYISSVMEFVFVEALVKNEVHLWAYFKKFMRKGFNFLLIRLALGLVFIGIFLLALLPLIPIVLTESSDFALLAFIGGIFWVFGIIILLALIGSVISSFLSLAIPISIYSKKGILSAFHMVYQNFRKNWKEVLVYWLIRIALGIAIGILVVILFIVLALALVIAFLIIDIILYFLFSIFISEPQVWILLSLFVLTELLFIFSTLLLLVLPIEVFMKYHLLSFLETWFADVDIPFFDKVLWSRRRDSEES
ncbi:MAG: hypothetical protein QM426_07720 [Euryarchaeota archaeon]|nr:hypothetical protein [Euryarchaeota archaeon]